MKIWSHYRAEKAISSHFIYFPFHFDEYRAGYMWETSLLIPCIGLQNSDEHYGTWPANRFWRGRGRAVYKPYVHAGWTVRLLLLEIAVQFEVLFCIIAEIGERFSSIVMTIGKRLEWGRAGACVVNYDSERAALLRGLRCYLTAAVICKISLLQMPRKGSFTKDISRAGARGQKRAKRKKKPKRNRLFYST